MDRTQTAHDPAASIRGWYGSRVFRFKANMRFYILTQVEFGFCVNHPDPYIVYIFFIFFHMVIKLHIRLLQIKWLACKCIIEKL